MACRSAATGARRAIGLDDVVRIDYLEGEVHVGDVFLLTTDGVHRSLDPLRLAGLMREGSAQQASDALVKAARAAGSRDDASALVVRVLGLDSVGLSDDTARLDALPALKRLANGEVVDGFVVTMAVADTGVHRLYQAREAATQKLVALKALHESRGGDAQERAMLAHEGWLGARLTEHNARGFVDRSCSPSWRVAHHGVPSVCTGEVGCTEP
jgi:hypothetical protein